MFEQKLEQTLDGCRWVYNYFCKSSTMTEYDMNYTLVELKEHHPWLRNYHSKMLQMVSKQVAGARKALDALRKRGYKTGKLKYSESKDYNSFTYNQSGFKLVRHGRTDLLWLSKVGYVEIRLHRKPVDIKQVTVVRQAEKWYAVIACAALRNVLSTLDYKKSVGIDVGITVFAYDSDNGRVDNPLFLTKMIKPLRRASRRLSRRKKGSYNYEKAKSWLVSLHRRIANKRNNFLHKVSTWYCKRYDLIFVERLRLQNMVKNHSLAKRIMDSGWGMFKQMLRYKANRVLEIEPYNTSVLCSRCGNKVPKTLAVRTHLCNKCGLVINRDYNASLNILQKGLLSLLPEELREVTPVEIVCRSRKQEEIYPFGYR